MAKFVYDTLKAKKVAILVDVRSDYSVGLQTFFGEAFKRRGGEIVANQSYSQGDSDFRAQLTQIKATNPEAIYVPGYYTEVGTIVHQGRELGITVPLHRQRRLGLAQALGDRRRGAQRLLLLQPLLDRRPESRGPEVRQRLQDQVRRGPGRAGRAGVRRGPDPGGRDARAPSSTDGDKIRKAIAATKDFPGVTGTITINAERNAVKPAVILKVENGKYLLVETITPEAVKQ